MSAAAPLQLMRPADLDLVYAISRAAYSHNFGEHWEKGGLEVYLDTVFSRDGLSEELNDPDIHYYVAFVGTIPIAFMKLNLRSNLPGEDPEKGIELDKLYILPEYKGSGIGRRFMELAFRVAGQLKKEVFWLAVIDTNTAAMAFYGKAGFQKHSTMRVGYPKFRAELRGMWRMVLDLRSR